MKKIKKNAKQRMLACITVIVVVLLIATTAFVFYESTEENIIVEEEEITYTIVDDQISPLENQGLIIEVFRIRHRGLYDKLMSRGNSWKTKPKFYFVTELDGLKYESKNVEHLGNVNPTFFVGWDTMFQENKIVRDAEEEQVTSEVTLSVVEVVKTGLLKRKSTEIERDKLKVTYDYRTGRWDGDDSFRDYDGYGHYLGTTFEVWFNIYQMDFDRDYIPYWTEVNILGTNPRQDDSFEDQDGDGVSTFWEWKWGYDPLTWDDHKNLDPDIDGLENIEEYQTEIWLSDPYHQDVYVEIDYMEKTDLFDPAHIYWEEGMQALMEKFAEHNINIYFDMGWPDTPRKGGGDVLPHFDGFSQDSGMILQFYNHYFPKERKGIFRYVVMGHGGPFNHPAKGNVYDCIHVGYSVQPKKLIKRFLYYQILPTKRETIIAVSSTLMHEIGHSIGIHPWTFEGCDNLSYAGGNGARNMYKETWGNYYSVMNYFVMYSSKLLDYSDGSNGQPYDQNDWLQLFVPCFQYNAELIEEIYFKPPGFDKIVYGETEAGITGYSYNEELTEKFVKRIGDWSPVTPIGANWLVFKLDDNDIYPDYKEIKILVQPNVPFAGWAEYAEGELDSEGNVRFYSQQTIIDILMQ